MNATASMSLRRIGVFWYVVDGADVLFGPRVLREDCVAWIKTRA